MVVECIGVLTETDGVQPVPDPRHGLRTVSLFSRPSPQILPRALINCEHSRNRNTAPRPRLSELLLAARSVELIEKAMRLNLYYRDWYLWHLAELRHTTTGQSWIA